MNSRTVELRRFAWIVLPSKRDANMLQVEAAEIVMTWTCYPPEPPSDTSDGDSGYAECTECFALPVGSYDAYSIAPYNLSHMLGENLVEVALEQVGIEEQEEREVAANDKRDRMKDERAMR